MQPPALALLTALSFSLTPPLLAAPFEIDVRPNVVYAEKVQGSDEPLMIDFHLPRGVEKPPLVLFIHGGGWRAGDRTRARLSWLARHGYAVASIDYRLSHEAVFPAQIHDCKGALRWLRVPTHAEKFGYDPARVVVAGTSAGGHLAALMGTSGDVAELEGETGGNLDQSSRVQGAMPYFGPSDFILRSKHQPEKTDDPNGAVNLLLGGPVRENEATARLASPVTHLSADDPPFLVVHGDQDKVVHIRQSEHLVEAAKKADVEATLFVMEGAGHGWKTTAEERETVLNFLRACFEQD